MNQYFHILFFSLILAQTAFGQGLDTLTVEQCRQEAVQNFPLQTKKQLAAQVATYQNASISRSNYPKISFGGQASWQSDVVALPFELPNKAIPSIPHDQYTVRAEVSQKIYDGHSARYLQQKASLDQAVTGAQTDLDAFALRETVTELFFNILLLQETEKILQNATNDLKNRREQATAMVNEGVALRTAADQISIRILQNEQQLETVQMDKAALSSLLAIWLKRDNALFFLRTPEAPKALDAAQYRPEFALFQVQKQQLQLGKDMLALRKTPKVELFAQAGGGRPNPLNFFETDFQPFFMGGIRAVWTPFDWGVQKKDAAVFEIQQKMVDAQAEAAQQRWQAIYTKNAHEMAKFQAQLASDDAIIRLQDDILQRTKAQVENGVATTADYLTQESLLTQARLNRKNHEILAQKAYQMHVAASNQPDK